MDILTFQLVAGAVLVLAAVMDLKSGRIPNWVSLVMLVTFGVTAAMLLSWDVVLWQVGFAVVVFGVGLGLYALTGAGAGAVKLMAAAALFLPMERGFALFGILLVAMFCMGFAVNMLRRVAGSEDSTWAVLKSPVMPLSLPVCATGLLGMFWL